MLLAESGALGWLADGLRRDLEVKTLEPLQRMDRRCEFPG